MTASPAIGGPDLDVKELEAALARAVAGEVRFDGGSRALYANDASNFRQPPIGLVVPRSIDDVVAVHRVCREFRAPILSRGAGTSLAGQAVNYAVVIDFSKYLHGIGEVDSARRTIRCEPGAINQKVSDVARKHGLVFAPDPSTVAYCTIGGNIGNNACGTHSVQSRFYGNGSRTSDNLEELEILTYDGLRMRVGATTEDEIDQIVAAGGRRGEIYRDLRDLRDRYADRIRERFPKIPRRVSGYNLDELLPERGFHVARALAGTEGTCATVLDATLGLIDQPAARALLVIGYDDIFSVGDNLREILDRRPIACEAIDYRLLPSEELLRADPAGLTSLPRGRAWVLVEFGGESEADAQDRARDLAARLADEERPPAGVAVFDDPRQAQRLWKLREAGVGATSFPPGGDDYLPGWEDAAVAPERVGDYLRASRALYDKYGYDGAMYGHLGDGCLHSRINFDLRSHEGVRTYRRFMEEAADLVVSYGGSLSGEHGDGQQRAELLPKMFGGELVQAFRQFKGIWDPDGKMNPGKVVDPYRLDQNLRLGPDYHPRSTPVKFSYPNDGGDFAHAALRCVGVGKCRKPDGVDVMCPSYMVTREEKHTTRGRARMLFEMLQGEVITDGWRSKEVYEALDLCLSCKGCTNDCPADVDMPTYKAEFLHHHWKGRLRPRHAYAIGLVDKAARVASKMPRAANYVASRRPFAPALKFAAGVTQARPVPALARETMQGWFRARPDRRVEGPTVVVWPDTFNNYFHADVGRAAVEALEDAGWNVVIPEGHVCCGRPLYDYGFLNTARRYLRRSVDAVREHVRAGVPLVGIEPSCLATFKDELPNLLPHDEDARRLAANAFHFAEFFERHEVELPRLDGQALLWGHCHQKATGGIEAEQAVLEKMGLHVDTVRGGCCGLAGSWGFETAHYDLSMACGEQALFPAVRGASEETLVVAGGFSCQTQIAAGDHGRRALHLAEVMKLARERATPPT